MLIFILLSLQVLSISYFFFTSIFFDTEKYEKIIIFSLIFFAWIVLSETFLGVFQQLNLFNLVVLNFIVLIILVLKNLKIKSAGNGKNDLKPRLYHLFYIPILFILILMFVRASMQLVIEADSLTYHLPYLVKWLQTQSIWTPYYNAYVGPIGYYPGNYELISLFVVLPFHRDVFVNLVNFFLYIPLGVAIYGVLNLLDVNQKIAKIAPVIFLFTPIIIRQASIPQNDLFLLFNKNFFKKTEKRKHIIVLDSHRIIYWHKIKRDCLGSLTF